MRGFFVIEFAPPFQWKPSRETYRGDTIVSTRYVWLWFSFTTVFGIKWTELLDMAGDVRNTTGHDEHQDNLGIG